MIRCAICLPKKTLAIDVSAVRDEQGGDPSSPLLDFLESFRARPSVSRQEWARDHWHSVQSVIDQVSALQAKAGSKPGNR